MLAVLSIQFSGITYIFVQPSLPPISRTLHLAKVKPSPLNTDCPAPSLSPWEPPPTLCPHGCDCPGASYQRDHTVLVLRVGLFHSASCFIHVSAGVRISFLFKAEQYSIVCVCCAASIRSLSSGHWGYSYLLASVNNATVNMGVKISVSLLLLLLGISPEGSCWVTW